MEIKIQSRQTGKSYGIAQELKKDKNAICLVITEVMRDYFIRTYNIDKQQVMTFKSALNENNLRGRHKLKIYIDEVGSCIDLLFYPHPVIYGTHT